MDIAGMTLQRFKRAQENENQKLETALLDDLSHDTLTNPEVNKIKYNMNSNLNLELSKST